MYTIPSSLLVAGLASVLLPVCSHAYIRHYIATDAMGNFVPSGTGSDPGGMGTTDGTSPGSVTGFVANLNPNATGVGGGWQQPLTNGFNHTEFISNWDNNWGANTTTFDWQLLDVNGNAMGTADLKATAHVGGGNASGWRGFDLVNFDGVSKIEYTMTSSNPLASDGTNATGGGSTGRPWFTGIDAQGGAVGTMFEVAYGPLFEATYGTSPGPAVPSGYTPIATNPAGFVGATNTPYGLGFPGTFVTGRHAINGYDPGDFLVQDDDLVDAMAQGIEKYYTYSQTWTIMAPNNADGTPGLIPNNAAYFFSIDGARYQNLAVAIPEPSRAALVLTALGMIGLRRRR